MKSTVPIKFHLLKPGGTVDNQQRNVQLVISGPDANGSPQEIVFSQANGKLQFYGCRYMAQLSSREYSLQADGSYTAAVKLGSAVLGTRDFQVEDGPDTSRSNSN